MDERDLPERLRALGDAGPDDVTRTEHLRRMATVPTTPLKRSRIIWVAAAAIVGFLAGSTGLAAAGALPDPAQDVAHDVLAAVQVDVPEGTRGACVSAIAKGDLSKDEKKAAKDACPKGGPPDGDEADHGDDDADGAGKGKSGSAPGQTKHADDPCRGKPPWAGKNDLTVEEKDALKAERAATCGRELDDDDADDAEDDADDDVAEDESGG